MAWTFHDKTACNLGTANDVKVSTTSDTKGSICGCRVAGCPGASPAPRPSPSPPGPPVTCESVFRPAKPTPVPLPAGKTQPHFVTVLVDDLGFDDASIRGKNVTYSPNLQALRKAGILLDRHHTYLWCSPTRRAFLTGRYPAHITGTQAGTCTNFTPLQFTILSEKLAAVGYESHFIGKGHLGYQTTDHLPINRGFAGHLGFLGGGESYTHGQSSRCGDGGIADMWHDHAPVRWEGWGGVERVGRVGGWVGGGVLSLSWLLYTFLALTPAPRPYPRPPSLRTLLATCRRSISSMAITTTQTSSATPRWTG